jgi:hypothetical protein
MVKVHAPGERSPGVFHFDRNARPLFRGLTEEAAAWFGLDHKAKESG